ncbi:hypothetical protein HMPREF1548_03409 [Clostridium sp. KLE 1755]|nr:hypothetical protein HMPREF1548_03409 [Clostridium sp. KLE 1755]
MIIAYFQDNCIFREKQPVFSAPRSRQGPRIQSVTAGSEYCLSSIYFLFTAAAD